jgi:hypothetical protein
VFVGGKTRVRDRGGRSAVFVDGSERARARKKAVPGVVIVLVDVIHRHYRDRGSSRYRDRARGSFPRDCDRRESI